MTNKPLYLIFFFFVAIGTAEMSKLYYEDLKKGNGTNWEEKGKKDHSQPAMRTHVLKGSNTNYQLLSISTKDNAEHNLVDNKEKQGKIVLLQETEIVKRYDNAQGGFITEAKTRKINPYPEDFNKDWTYVEKSTP